jgi:tRNA threonylcarbamoyl adenosine modification protein YeaZ
VILLGIDTATQATVVGLRLADGSTLQARDEPTAHEHPGHATRLLEMAGGLLTQAEIGWGELQRIAVGRGPGRFTGLRVGIATARGLAQALDIELVGVSSLQALGLAAARHEPASAILAVIDARRRETFVAAYPAGVDFARERRENEALAGEVDLPGALGAARLQSVVEEAEQRGAPQGERWLAVGDGALAFSEELAAAGLLLAPADSRLDAIDPGAICELGAHIELSDAAGPVAPDVLPDYRRSPDAALARQRPLALGGAAS